MAQTSRGDDILLGLTSIFNLTFHSISWLTRINAHTMSETPQEQPPICEGCVAFSRSQRTFVPKNSTKVMVLNPHMQMKVAYVGYGSPCANTLNDLNHKQLSSKTFISLEV